jgi:hypothetical protein
MTQLINGKPDALASEDKEFRFCRELEKGNILFFPKTPFPFPKEEIDFLLNQRQSGSKSRKNIAYKPQIDKVTNHAAATAEEMECLRMVLCSFSTKATQFLSQILSPYATRWKLDYASFRPFQEKGRNLRLRARNDLLHVDAFPTRPMHGSRILRFFINLNPTEGRRWMTSMPFADLAQKFAGSDLLFPKSNVYSLGQRLKRKMTGMLASAGLKITLRSPYDLFMLRMHNFLKENVDFQKNCPKFHWEFPPGSCWAVFTDQVSHAALSGQYALEQTFLVPNKALLYPDQSPVSILERLSNRNMIDPIYAGSD